MTMPKPVLAVLGGTGHEGGGLALRWAQAGYPVIIGSRSAERAGSAASELNQRLGKSLIRGADNLSAARDASIVVLAVPFSAQIATARETESELAGKILVDVTVPLVPPSVSRVQLPNGGSAVDALQRALGDKVKVVSAFQNVSAHHLKDLDHSVECDVLVCGDDKDACDAVIRLAMDAGLRGFYAGALVNSIAAEALTSVLIAINRRYKVPGSGIRITGVPLDQPGRQ
jgi:NADPH-dependent F420 reductase